MMRKIRFCNRFDIALLSLAAVGFLVFQAYIRTDRYRARELVDEYGLRMGSPNMGHKPSILAMLGLAPRPPREDWRPVMNDLKSVAEEAAPLLAQRLIGGDPRGDMYACALANLGNAARPYLIEGLRSPSRHIREESAYALGGLRREALPISPEMLSTLHDEDGIVRQSMARSFARIDRAVASQEALPVILSDLRNPNLAVVLYATASLAELGPVNDASQAAVAEAEKGRFAQVFASVVKDRDRP